MFFFIRLNVKATSSAVIGCPSLHFTPSRMVKTIEGATGKALGENERKLLIRGAEEEDLVNSGLEETMSVAWHQIRDAQRKHPKSDLRTAAFISAIDKIAVSYLELGIFP